MSCPATGRDVPGGGPGPRAGKLRCAAHVTVDHTTMGSSNGALYMSSHQRNTHSMDADDLDYLEKRALPYAHLDSKQQRPQSRQHHSEGLFGISLYGVIILCFLLFAGLAFYGIVHGFWNLCLHYSAHSATAATSQGRHLVH